MENRKGCEINNFESYLLIKWPNGENRKFYYMWLRDHCSCENCYNKKTNQKSVDILTIPLDIKPLKSEIDSDALKLIWHDNHKTDYSLSWLLDIKSTSKKEIVLWNQKTVRAFQDCVVSLEDYSTEAGLKTLLRSLLKYGLGFVTGVDVSLEATEAVAKRIGLIQKTLFGEMWTVSNDYYHSDTAYTNIGLGVHTDNTYFTEAAGLQIFHMLSHEGSGGETLLVDGFNAAENMKKNHPDDFKILCDCPIEAKYIEDGYHYSTIEPVIKLHPLNNKLFQIRFNIHDRAVLNCIDEDKIFKFYSAYKKFGEELNKIENVYEIKLIPGTVIFIDNWRVLHGRNSYNGLRQLCGCYTSRADWLSKAKTLNLDII